MEGNQQKMREAVIALLDALDSLGCDESTATLAAFVPDMADSSARCLAAFRKAKEALSAPPRNCDVGTSDEQAERFENFCLKHIGCAEETGGRHCVGCPLEKASRNITQKCELYWSQMPYEKGDDK